MGDTMAIVYHAYVRKSIELSNGQWVSFLWRDKSEWSPYPEVVECSVGETLSGDIFRKGLDHAGFLHA